MDMESLLRQALNNSNSSDPEVRLKIYEVARSALSKATIKNRDLSPDIIRTHEQNLENLIQAMEKEFLRNIKPESVPETDKNRAPAQSSEERLPLPQVSIPKSFDPVFTQQEKQLHINHDSSSQPAPKFLQQQYQQQKTGYTRPHRKPARYIVWFFMILVTVVFSWIAHNIASEILNPGQSGNSGNKNSRNKQKNTTKEAFIILSPEQPHGLTAAENGVVEILDNTLHPAIRIMSVRQMDNYNEQARPILLQLPPGVLKDIAGKQAVVEILAKSGNGGTATFTVSCNFGELGECSRKRFLIGNQPRTVVFSIRISADYKEGQKAFLGLNTDATRQASLSGKGSKIDIIYARIYVNHDK